MRTRLSSLWLVRARFAYNAALANYQSECVWWDLAAHRRQWRKSRRRQTPKLLTWRIYVCGCALSILYDSFCVCVFLLAHCKKGKIPGAPRSISVCGARLSNAAAAAAICWEEDVTTMHCVHRLKTKRMYVCEWLLEKVARWSIEKRLLNNVRFIDLRIFSSCVMREKAFCLYVFWTNGFSKITPESAAEVIPESQKFGGEEIAVILLWLWVIFSTKCEVCLHWKRQHSF